MNIIWVARCPTPYRYPIWDELAGHHALRVVFFQKQGIGRPWRMEERSEFEQVAAKTRGLPYREDALWVLQGKWQRHFDGADVVIMQGLWETPAAWQILRWCRQHSVPLICFFESTLGSMRWKRGPIRWARQSYLRSATTVITPGVAATEAVLWHGVRPTRIATSVNVIDVERFREGTWRIRNASVTDPPPRSGHRFLIVARLLGRKNIESALLAFSTLQNDARLDIAGDGPARESLRDLAARLDVSERVRFRGDLDESRVMELLAESYTLMLPSTEEVWGLVVNEALAAGLHVVVSDQCGVAPAVDGQQGVFVSSPDPDALGAAMAQSMEQWSGWLSTPEILTHDAQRFVADLSEILPAPPTSPRTSH